MTARPLRARLGQGFFFLLLIHGPTHAQQTVGLFVNDHQMFEPTYQRFIINRFRELLPYAEVPIKLLIRGKKTIPAEARMAAQHT